MEKNVPPRPRTLSCRYENNGDSLALRDKAPLAAIFTVGGFLTLWLTGWTAGCVVLVRQVLEKPSFFMVCFTIPFLVGWFAAFGALMAIVFGRKRLRLDEDGLWNEYRVLFRISSRRVPLGEIQYFHATTKENSESVSCSVEAVTGGQPISYSAANSEEALWLAHEMNRMLEVLKREAVAVFAEEEEEEDEADEAVVIPWNSRPGRAEPPSDCRWKMDADVDSVTFHRRGDFSWAVLGGTTFAMLFWNGIVSVFVMALFGVAPSEKGMEFFSGEWWFLFVFLIPFEVIGIGLFLAWLSALSSPFWRTRWSVGRHEAVCRVGVFGIGRRWWYSLENCREMVMETRDVGEKEVKISFVDFQDETLCEIGDLTTGEAKWMADNILLYR